MFTSFKWAVATLWLPLSGCASLPDDGLHAYSQGWRHAVVLAVDTAAQEAVAAYSYGGNPNLKAKAVAPIPINMHLNVGDHVLVNVRDGQAAISKDAILR